MRNQDTAIEATWLWLVSSLQEVRECQVAETQRCIDELRGSIVNQEASDAEARAATLGQTKDQRLREAKTFFIVGCQRTGTTLMRLILECHPKIELHDELTAYDLLRSGGGDETSPATNLIGFKIPRWTEKLADPSIAAEPGDEGAPRLYNGQPLIFMHRDVRDVVVSMLCLQADGANWIDLWGRPILEHKIQQEPSFRRRYATDIAFVRDLAFGGVSVGALYWKYKTEAYLRYKERGWPILPVRYEHLVRRPEYHLRRVIALLGVEWTPDLLRHHEHNHAEASNGRTVGGTDTTRSIDTRSTRGWETALSATDLQQIEAIAGETNRAVESL